MDCNGFVVGIKAGPIVLKFSRFLAVFGLSIGEFLMDVERNFTDWYCRNFGFLAIAIVLFVLQSQPLNLERPKKMPQIPCEAVIIIDQNEQGNALLPAG